MGTDLGLSSVAGGRFAFETGILKSKVSRICPNEGGVTVNNGDKLIGLLHLVVIQNRDKSFTFGRSRVRVNSWYISRVHASCSPVGGFKTAPGSRFLVRF